MDIPYKSHIKHLGIIETLIDLIKCIVIKLLHRDQMAKNILIENITARREGLWLYKDIKRISEYLNIEIERVCYYPDIIRKIVIEKYYEGNIAELE